MKKILIVLVFFASLLALADKFSDLEIFSRAFFTIKNYSYKPVERKSLIYSAIKGMLRDTDDHSQFLEPSDLKDLEEGASGHFFGIGIQAKKEKDGFITILSLIKDSPAKKAGLKKGDKVLKVGKRSLKDYTEAEFEHLFSKKRNQYKLEILRKNKKMTFFIRSSSIKINTVLFEDLKEGLFYLRILYFSKNTLEEVNQALKDKKIKGLLIDLRNCPGGIFDQAVKVADLFLDKGRIVSKKTTLDEKKTEHFDAHFSDTLENFPLVVLIDENSASGAEILAASLKEHKRATLMGRKSYGKGSIQTVFNLPGDHALKLTIGEYKTPKGKSIHGKGISPHIQIKKVVEDKKKEKNKDEDLLSDQEILTSFNKLKTLVK